MFNALRNVRTPGVKRPFGVWLLTSFDFFVLGITSIVLDARRILTLLTFQGPPIGEPSAEAILGIQALFAMVDGLLLLWAVAICFAAYRAWLGRDRARVVLTILVTIRALFLIGPDSLVALVAIPVAALHWWYFWRSEVLGFYYR
jgi:hypothetical protein